MVYTQEQSVQTTPKENLALDFLGAVYHGRTHEYKKVLPSEILSPVFSLLNTGNAHITPERLAILSGHVRNSSVYVKTLDVLEEQKLILPMQAIRKRPNTLHPRTKYKAAHGLAALAIDYNQLYRKAIGNAIEAPMSEKEVSQISLNTFMAFYRTAHNLAPDIPLRDALPVVCETESLHPQTVIHEALGDFATEQRVLRKAQNALYKAALARVE